MVTRQAVAMTMRQAVVMATSVLILLVVMKSMMKAQVAGKWTTKFEKFEDFHHFSIILLT